MCLDTSTQSGGGNETLVTAQGGNKNLASGKARGEGGVEECPGVGMAGLHSA